MKKIITTAFLLLLLASFTACNRKPYINRKIKITEIGKDCSAAEGSFKMNSNIAGERYEFQKCLPAGYKTDLVTAQRQGDTILIQFPINAPANTVYQVTLDIDSYPSYQFLTIDGDTYAIVNAQK